MIRTRIDSLLILGRLCALAAEQAAFLAMAKRAVLAPGAVAVHSDRASCHFLNVPMQPVRSEHARRNYLRRNTAYLLAPRCGVNARCDVRKAARRDQTDE